MTDKDVFLAICGIDEDGDGRAVSMIETLYAATDPSREDRTVDSITFDGHPVNIFRSLRSTMVDIQFRDNTDYDYIQALDILKGFSNPENSVGDVTDGIPTIQLTVMPKELEGLYYMVGIHGVWYTMADEPGRLPNIIRFIFDNDLLHTYRIPEEALEAEDMGEETVWKEGCKEGE